MIDPIKKTIQQIKKLPVNKQIKLAQLIQDELSWDATFLNTQDELATLVKAALKEYKEGNASDKGW